MHSRDVASFPKFQTGTHTAWQQNTIFSIRIVQEIESVWSPCFQNCYIVTNWVCPKEAKCQVVKSPQRRREWQWALPPATELTTGHGEICLSEYQLQEATGCWPMHICASTTVPRQRRGCKWHHPKSPADSQGKMSHGGDLYPSEEVGPMTSKGFQIKRCGNSSSLTLVNISGPFHRKRKPKALN